MRSHLCIWDYCISFRPDTLRFQFFSSYIIHHSSVIMNYLVSELKVFLFLIELFLFEFFCYRWFLPCRRPSFLSWVPIIPCVSVWVIWIFVSRRKIYTAFVPTLKHMPSTLFYPKLQYAEYTIMNASWFIKKNQLYNLPDHFLTKPSNCASRREPLQNGKTVQSDSSNPQARQFD